MASRLSARTLHTIADELGVAPELAGRLATEQGIETKQALRDAIAAYASTTTDTPSTPVEDAPAAPKKERQPGLTLSQRRALLRLLDLDGDDLGHVPTTAFKSLPYEKLVDVGYATRETISLEGQEPTSEYRLTDDGRARATSINPGYRVWASGETVAGDPTRPEAGTKRSGRTTPTPPTGATVAMQSAARG